MVEGAQVAHALPRHCPAQAEGSAHNSGTEIRQQDCDVGMRTIFKYELDMHGVTQLNIPPIIHITQVGLDPHGTPCLWILHQHPGDTGERRNYEFVVTGTGSSFDTSWDVAGTFMKMPFVWHVLRRLVA